MSRHPTREAQGLPPAAPRRPALAQAALALALAATPAPCDAAADPPPNRPTHPIPPRWWSWPAVSRARISAWGWRRLAIVSQSAAPTCVLSRPPRRLTTAAQVAGWPTLAEARAALADAPRLSLGQWVARGGRREPGTAMALRAAAAGRIVALATRAEAMVGERPGGERGPARQVAGVGTPGGGPDARVARVP